jgi:hypothetical protein
MTKDDGISLCDLINTSGSSSDGAQGREAGSQP